MIAFQSFNDNNDVTVSNPTPVGRWFHLGIVFVVMIEVSIGLLIDRSTVDGTKRVYVNGGMIGSKVGVPFDGL